MDEQVIRAMVREALTRQLGHPVPSERHEPQPLGFPGHASHRRYLLPESEGPCLIEPSVRCNHCGYCESHGH